MLDCRQVLPDYANSPIGGVGVWPDEERDDVETVRPGDEGMPGRAASRLSGGRSIRRRWSPSWRGYGRSSRTSSIIRRARTAGRIAAI